MVGVNNESILYCRVKKGWVVKWEKVIMIDDLLLLFSWDFSDTVITLRTYWKCKCMDVAEDDAMDITEIVSNKTTEDNYDILLQDLAMGLVALLPKKRSQTTCDLLHS